MTVKVHKLKAGGWLDSIETHLDRALAVCEKKVFAVLELPDVDLVVQYGKRVIPELGLVGHSYGANHGVITIDPNNKNLRKSFEINLVATVGHEMHHCARVAKKLGGTTLQDIVIMEGLACHFETELRGEAPFYAAMLFDIELEKYLPVYLAHRNDVRYDYASWFFGTKPEWLPRFAGYSIGYAIVNRYVRETGIPASQLVGTPSEEFGCAV